jgi:2-oxoglutarate dehydrogenase E2 component (dihydrolipoamide succinyltransferase)
MSIEVKVPVLPESVADAVIATWHKKPGDSVRRDENLVDLETDKVVLEVPAPTDGVLKQIIKNTGDTVGSQELIAIIEAGAVAAAAPEAKSIAASAAPTTAAPTTAALTTAAPTASNTPTAGAANVGAASSRDTSALSPAGRRVAEENKLNPAEVSGSGRGGQVTKEDLVNFMRSGGTAQPAAKAPAAAPAVAAPSGPRSEQRVPMTRMRTRIAERMMQSKNSIAMLTSFNEINLKAVSEMRKTHGEAFEKTHGDQARFHEFLRQGGSRCTQASSNRECLGRWQ